MCSERLKASRVFAPLRSEPVGFWLALALLNALLFLPAFVLDSSSTSAAFLYGEVGETDPNLWRAVRHGLDRLSLFRMSAEVLVIGAVWAHLAPARGTTGRVIVAVVYVFALSFQVYEAVVLSLYGQPGDFFAHYHLARDGLPFLFENLHLPLIAFVGVAAMIGVLFWTLLRLWTVVLHTCRANAIGRVSKISVAVLAAIALIFAASGPTIGASAYLQVGRTVQRSLESQRESRTFAGRSYSAATGLLRQPLRHKPDVYLIFVESYGSVLLRRPDYAEAYRRLLEELEPTLLDAGWHVASAMSESPTWGGGSWMAYTSALFGTRIESHPQYLELLSAFSQSERAYPGLPRYLRDQGYETLWLSPIAKELTNEKWEQYRRFYSIDTWLRHRDFDYEGREYGWGPAPPDQYVLEYVRTNHVDTAEQPVFTMFVTQNSHFPYEAPLLVEDWRTLSGASDEPDALGDEEISHQELRSNYFAAIEYELRMLTEFITGAANGEHGEEDAIFILIGDHQPPRVSRRDDTFDTPVHVITRHAETTDLLLERGFAEGLLAPLERTQMGHEELLPLVLDVLHSFDPP